MIKDAYIRHATMVRWVDGDTCDVLIDLGMKIFVKKRVRMYGVNTPETYGRKKGSDEYKAGMKAKNRMIELCPVGTKVILQTHKPDATGKYGRYLAEVVVKETNINLNDTLVDEGLAKQYFGEKR